jgi:hypothetical protein
MCPHENNFVNKMKKGITIAVTLLLVVIVYPANAQIKAGETLCSKKGERKVENRVTYVCAMLMAVKQN